MQSASHLLRRCQENPGHPMRSHLPRLLFLLAPRFALGVCRYFCSASALTFQSPCMVNQNPSASSASWARLCSHGPIFPMGSEMDHPRKCRESHLSKVLWQHPCTSGRDLASPTCDRLPHLLVGLCSTWLITVVLLHPLCRQVLRAWHVCRAIFMVALAL